jgi:hypothetical protein
MSQYPECEIVPWNGGRGVLSSPECSRLDCPYPFLPVNLSFVLALPLPDAVSVSVPTEWRLRSVISWLEGIRLHYPYPFISVHLLFLLALALSLSEAASVSLPTEWRL